VRAGNGVRLDGRVVLVSGGGAGIGRGVVEVCHEAGATVVVGTLEAATLEAGTFDNLERVEVEHLDVANPAAVKRWVDAAAERHGGIDGLVANAGLTLHPPFLDVDLDTLDRLWCVNQRGVFLSAQAVARVMVAQGQGGAIVAVASNHARASDAGYEMYAATKAAIVAMSRAMAWSLGSQGIRVNSLSPGLTRTETVAAAAEADPATEARFRSWHATARLNTVHEVGECAAFLLSDAASAVTGTDLIADQGMSARLGDLS